MIASHLSTRTARVRLNLCRTLSPRYRARCYGLLAQIGHVREIARVRSEHSVRTLHDHCLKRAKGRPVVIGLRDKGRPGGLVVVHSDDLDVMCVEWLKSRPIGGGE